MAEDIEDKNFVGFSYHNTSGTTKIEKATSAGIITSETHPSGTGRGILADGSRNDFTANNSSEATMGSKFRDIRGSDNKYVAGGQTTVSRGDVNLKVGNLNAAAANLDALIKEGIHKEKSKFEIQRTDYKSIYNSPDQKRSGAYKPCPECSQGKKYPAVNSNIEEELNKLVAIPMSWLQNAVSSIAASFGIKVDIPDVNIKFPGLSLISFPPPAKCTVCNGTAESPFSYDGDWAPEPGKEEIQKMYEEAGSQLAAAEESMGDGGNYLAEISRNMVINVGMAMNKMSDIRIDDKGKKSPLGVSIGEERVYQKQAETPLVEKVHVDDLMGGTFSLIAGNGANFIVGSRGLCFDCFGSCRINGSRVDIAGAQVNISSKNEVNLFSDKRVAIEGAMVSMKSSSGQVVMENNMGISGNAIIAGGAHIEGETFVNHITAPMELQRTDKAPILFGQANESDEKKIGFLKRGTEIKCMVKIKLGGIANLAGPVEGESEAVITILDEPGNNIPVITAVQAAEVEGPVGSAPGTPPPIESKPDEEAIFIYPHNHVFRNIPLTLTGSNKEVRTAAAACEGKQPVPPTEVKMDEKKGPNKDKDFYDKDAWDQNAKSGKQHEGTPLTFKPSDKPTVKDPGEPAEFKQESYIAWKEGTTPVNIA